MRTAVALILLWSPAIPWGVQAAAPAPLSFTISPVLDGQTVRAVAIELQFRADASTQTTLELPKEWGGKDKLYEALSDFQVQGTDASITAGEEPELRIVRHRPNSPLRIRYLVHHADEGANRDGNPYRPIILPQRLQLLGQAVFAAPQGLKDDQPVEVRFKGFPKGWAFASDLEHGHLTLDSLRESIIVAGDYRVLTRQIHGARLRLAIQGKWPFEGAWFADNLAAISNAQYDFWGDRAQPYLVAFSQIDSGGTAGGGTGLGDAFAMFATPDYDPHDLVRTLAHEMTHTWIPRRVGTVADEQQVEALDYWLSEGFTDYYANRVLMRAAVWSPQDFATSFNVALKRYASSPARNVPNSAIGLGFWKDSNLQQMPYDRGLLFATWLDWKLRGASNGRESLDEVMLSMHRQFAQSPAPIRKTFLAAVNAQGLDIQLEMTNYIEAGYDILLDPDTFAPCGRIVTADLPSFSRGFDIDATTRNGLRITGVDPELPAYRAGLRDGMTIVKRDAGVIGDSQQELAYRVLDHGTERVIRYLPQGHGTTRTQTLELQIDESVAALAECRRRLGASN